MIECYHSNDNHNNITYLYSENSFLFDYPCENYWDCSPYEIKFNPGIYYLEVWGASGGSLIDSSSTGKGGTGGHSAGVFIVSGRPKELYLYLGGFKDNDLSNNNEIPPAAFNGGGKPNRYNNGIGGGASDFRTKNGLWNNTLDQRILVAGGGGSGWVFIKDGTSYNGGNGGGWNGTSGEGEKCPSQYGTQNGSNGGEKCNCTVSMGGFGYGAEGWGTGGGGYHGGSTVYNGGGAGGSGYIDVNHITSYGKFQPLTEVSSHYGFGKAKITIITSFTCQILRLIVKKKLFTLIFITLVLS